MYIGLAALAWVQKCTRGLLHRCEFPTMIFLKGQNGCNNSCFLLNQLRVLIPPLYNLQLTFDEKCLHQICSISPADLSARRSNLRTESRLFCPAWPGNCWPPETASSFSLAFPGRENSFGLEAAASFDALASILERNSSGFFLKSLNYYFVQQSYNPLLKCSYFLCIFVKEWILLKLLNLFLT